ncbi:hypothetical protein O181_002599 [Austropuccinia psidii MF-1]|uniref:Uncharacterized protein n=1 Tax=Austropuccinia psidii MF-1 TaxID=1389203 RepID=A0A9Q3BCJ9_9BASI|nr:hypothetical protein [Austropuccinia psidii MF-1]
MLVILPDKHTRNACLLSDPSNHISRGVPDQEALVRTPLWSTMMKAFPSGNGRRDPKPPVPSKQKQQNPQRKDSPIPSLPREQTLRQLTPGPSGTQWSEDLFRGYAHWIPPHVPPPSTPTPVPSLEIPPISPKNLAASSPPVQGSPHSHNEACQEFTDLQLTLIVPQAIVHESINQILLEYCQLFHMIPFVDVTHPNETHQEFLEELSTLLGQAVEDYPKEEITGIVSKYLNK